MADETRLTLDGQGGRPPGRPTLTLLHQFADLGELAAYLDLLGARARARASELILHHQKSRRELYLEQAAAYEHAAAVVRSSTLVGPPPSP